MKQSNHSQERVRSFFARIGGATGVLLALALVLAAPVSASYEQVDSFGEESSKSPIREATSVAVNTTGAGGVPAGTQYAASGFGARYSARGEFLGSWGPGAGAVGVAVDQTTGNVYVLRDVKEGQNAVQVYSPDGSKLIASFGERRSTFTETVDEGPERLHDLPASGIAVDDSGVVYVSDRPGGGSEPETKSRVMVFEPQTPGDYEHYVYAGRSNDIAVSYSSRALALDSAGNLYTAGGDFDAIYQFALSEPAAPTCEFQRPSGGIEGMTVNPKSGEVFYFTEKTGKIHRLSPCNAQSKLVETESIGLTPKPLRAAALAFNPNLAWEASRPTGILYVLSSSGTTYFYGGLGYILAPAEIHPPSVESQSVASVTSTTATLGAQINPKGSETSYAFQYLTEAAYQANNPDERQSLTVSATGGSFGLGLGGRNFGGSATASLTSGSATATSLVTASGTGTLKAANGTGTLKAASGKGTVISGSATLTAVTTSSGTFEAGQQIKGNGIPQGTTIVSIKPEEDIKANEITISKPATQSAAKVELKAGSSTITSLTTSEGTFEVGQQVKGNGIPAGTTILAVKAGELTLSEPASVTGVGVGLSAGSEVLTALTTSEGTFEVGQQVKGEGIPAQTKILAVEAGALTLSNPASVPGTSVPIASEGPGPLSVGQRIEGAGVPPNTTIAALKAGELTLSNPATASGTGVLLHAGLPTDAPATKVRDALASFPTIGAGNVEVSGGPGDEAGSSPYEIVFRGALTNTDLPQISADSSGLTGSSASATVQTENDGGGGFDEGATEAPLGGAVLGSGQDPLSAATALVGLEPDTRYRFRVIAASACDPEKEEPCEDVGDAQAFRTSPAEAPELPDDRAWELVSPAQKQGGEVMPVNPSLSSCFECKPGISAPTFPKQSAPDGESVVYEGFPFSTTEGAANFNEYLSRRTASGWQTRFLSPFLQGGFAGWGHKAFNAELTQGLLSGGRPSLSPDAPAEYPNLYTQPTATPSSLTPLVGFEPPNRFIGSGTAFELTYAGASADFSKLFFEANDALTGETPFAPEAIDGGAQKNSLYEWTNGTLRLVNVLPGNSETVPGVVFGSGKQLEGNQTSPRDVFSHAISTDGSRVFWSDEAGQVYVRENGESTSAIPDLGKFLTASADGSQVLLNNGHLYDLESEEVTDLTESKGGFQGILGQGEELSHIYFVDTAVLTGEEENDHGAKAQAGQYNLYAWHEEQTTFVATLLPGDDNFSLSAGDWRISPVKRTAEASPGGRWVTFLSQAPLTGYDNNTSACGLTKGKSGPCFEVFLYDSASGELICPSCNPSGTRPLGISALTVPSGAPGSYLQPRYLTDSGRLYFDSRDSLSPFDTNNGVEDIYQYEPEGVGSCKREGGCVSLISAGHERNDSNFFAIDATGKNVFFTTRDQLVLKDRDDLIDLYVAREGGGIPAETETARPSCQGEACQPAVVLPNDPTPGTATLQGAGNVVEKKAAKKSQKKARKKQRKKKHKRANRRHKRANDNRGGAR